MMSLMLDSFLAPPFCAHVARSSAASFPWAGWSVARESMWEADEQEELEASMDAGPSPSTSKQQPSRTFLGTCTRTLMRFREGLGAPAPLNHANARGALPQPTS